MKTFLQLAASSALFLIALGSGNAFAQTTPAAPVAPASHIVSVDSLTWRAAGPGAEIAVVNGNPAAEGAFVIALRFAAGGMIPPHWHPGETRVVVISGEAVVGIGDVADLEHTPALKPGGFAVIPAEAHHFEAGKTASVIYVMEPAR